MKLTAPILLLLTLPIMAQNDTATGPVNAHEYAINQINAFNEYRKSKGYNSSEFFFYKFCVENKCQAIYVDSNGKITLDGITSEDAILLLLGSDLEKKLTDSKRRDAEYKQKIRVKK